MLKDVSTGGQIGRHSVTCTLDVCETARLYFWPGGFTITRRDHVSRRTWHLRGVRRPVTLSALIKLIYCRSPVVGAHEGYASSLHFALTHLFPFLSFSTNDQRSTGPNERPAHHSSGPSWHFNWRGVNQPPLSGRRVIISSCLTGFPPPISLFLSASAHTLSLFPFPLSFFFFSIKL